jgi:hypothetical protein
MQELKALQDELKKHNIEVKKEKEILQEKKLEELEKGVEEKIKTRKKLTVEDLLVFQKKEEED